MDKTQSLIHETTDEARALGRQLMTDARYGALAVLHDGRPMVTRVAVGLSGPDPLILVSTLSTHTAALTAQPACSLLLGEPDAKGDPLTYPRLTLQADAVPCDKAEMRQGWLETHPKSKLYIDFADFIFFRLRPVEAHLNGGFGRAFHLTPADLTPA